MNINFCEPPNNSIKSDVNDPFFQIEIKKSNELNEKVQIINNKKEKYSIRIQNLNKFIKKSERCYDCYSENLEAIKNLNLCVE